MHWFNKNYGMLIPFVLLSVRNGLNYGAKDMTMDYEQGDPLEANSTYVYMQPQATNMFWVCWVC